jgi:Ocular albinism type 1 protein
MVMIANPILYFICSKEVDKQLIQRYGQYTNNERQIHDLFKIKFSLLNIIFYVCWLPNIINAVLMWTMWFNLPIRVIIVSWYIMAILNPLQAFFNTLVYRKWNNKINCCISLRNCIVKKFRGNVVTAQPSPNETSPLLHNVSEPSLSRRASQHVSEGESSRRPSHRISEVESDNFHRYSIQCPLV